MLVDHKLHSGNAFTQLSVQTKKGLKSPKNFGRLLENFEFFDKIIFDQYSNTSIQILSCLMWNIELEF